VNDERETKSEQKSREQKNKQQEATKHDATQRDEEFTGVFVAVVVAVYSTPSSTVVAVATESDYRGCR